MEENTENIKGLVITKLIISFLLAGWLLKSLVMPAEQTLIFLVFLFFALLFEITSFRLPFFGEASPAYCIYFAVLIIFGAPLAVLSVIIVSIFRSLMLYHQNIWFGIADFADNLLTISISGIAYQMINGSSGFLTARNIYALIAAALIYSMLEYLLPAVFIGASLPEKQKQWNMVKTKINFINIAVMPLAVITALLYFKNAVLTLFILPVLIVFRYIESLAVHTGELKLQDIHEGRIDFLESELKRSKESNQELNNDLHKKIDELSVFFELGRVLGANLALDSVLDNIISMIRRLIYCQSCVIFLYNREKELTPYKYSTPYKDVLEARDLLKLEESVVKSVTKDNKPLLFGDMSSSGEQRIFKDENSIMCVPLIVQNELIGVIYIGDKNPNSFTSEHLQSVSNLANASAIAIKSAFLFEAQEDALELQRRINEQLDNRIKEITVISDFGKMLGSTLHLQETLKIIADASRSRLDYETCAVFLLEGEGEEKHFTAKHVASPYANYFKALKTPYKDGALGWVYINKKVLMLEDVNDSVLDGIVEQEKSIVIAPLIAENQVIGAIYFGAAVANTFAKDQMGFVISISYQAAMAIKKAEFHERIAALAITDGLTGLYTHRYLQERLEEIIKWAERYSKPVSLLFIDLDHFKQYNDTLGHPAGDSVLAEIAVMLKSYTRESDLVCRYGGDEFALALMDINKQDATVIAERIREGFFTRISKHPVQITGSIGVSEYPSDAKTKAELIMKADGATYKSKHGGKNKVTQA